MFSSYHELYPVFRQLRNTTILIDGIIGVGKSTLGKSLEQFLNGIGIPSKFYGEYVNPRLLSQYISDMKKYAYTFQMVMLTRRFEIYRDAKRFASSGGVSIIDRNLLGDYAFAYMQYKKGNITEEEWKIYTDMYRLENVDQPDYVLFLDCGTETALRRTRRRGVDSESSYTLQYFEDVKKSYEDIYNELYTECPLIKYVCIDWGTDVNGLNISIDSEENNHTPNATLPDDVCKFVLQRLIEA